MYMLPSSTCRFLVCRFLHLLLRLNTAKIMAGWNNFTVDPAGYLPAFHSEKRLNKLLIYIYIKWNQSHVNPIWNQARPTLIMPS
jgi:hypothetical protein